MKTKHFFGLPWNFVGFVGFMGFFCGKKRKDLTDIE